MKIRIETLVEQDIASVWKKFNQQLFLKLNPPFPPVKLLRFDGCIKGDKVQLELNFIFFKQEWHSLITENEEREQQIYFIDEGTRVPFFLKTWEHRHILNKNGEGTCIVDDISFTTPFLILDWLMYPVMYLQFLYRKPIYQKYFST